jgi:hypothetical protein
MTTTSLGAETAASGGLKRWLLRSGVIFLGLQVALSLSEMIPGLATAKETMTASVGTWLGRTVFGLTREIPLTPNGSGDRTILWLEMFGIASASLVAAAVSAVRTPSAVAERRWVATGSFLLRFWLGTAMVGYGLSKIFLLQFPFPAGDKLVQPLGEGSPMGLIWTMVGLSPAYQIVGGVLELVGGAMIFFRRTLALGAMLIAGVMAHVVLLNYCYDIPVKLQSTLLLGYAIALLVPYAKPLLDVLWFNRPAQPRVWPEPPKQPWVRRLLVGGKIVFLAFLTWDTGQGAWAGSVGAKPEIYALYEVESFKRAGADVPPLATDEGRWRYFTLNGRGGAVIRSVGGKRTTYRAKTDLEKNEVTLTPQNGDEKPSVLAFSPVAPGKLRLTGRLGDAPLEVVVRRREPNEFLLINRGFRWINETPFNR